MFEHDVKEYPLDPIDALVEAMNYSGHAGWELVSVLPVQRPAPPNIIAGGSRQLEPYVRAFYRRRVADDVDERMKQKLMDSYAA
jgi:hypothetical protein